MIVVGMVMVQRTDIVSFGIDITLSSIDWFSNEDRTS